MKLKKAAMFGLDARIALAIFGALSVISGAALYSAIQHSKVVATISELEELGKAFDAYYLDMGEMMQKHATSKYALYTGELIADTTSSTRWKGPYITLEAFDNTSIYSTVNNPLVISLQYRPGTDWGGATGDALPPTECTTAPCYIWSVVGSADTSLAHALDEYVDGTQDNTKGRVRLWDYTATNKSNIYYQYSVAPVQP